MKRSVMVVWLFAIFLLSLLLNQLILWHFSSSMEPSDEAYLSLEILKIHSMPLGLLLGAIFAKNGLKGRVLTPLFAIGITVCVTWLVLVASSWHGYPERVKAMFCAGDSRGESCPSVQSRLLELTTDVSFIIAGVLAFVSGKEGPAA